MKALELLFSDPAPVRFLLRRLIKGIGIGSYRFRLAIGAVDRPHYGYIIYEAAKLASRLGQKRISVLEYGVAGGTGLLAMERHAEAVERIFPVKIEIYGFDTGGGLPAPEDYRDLPYLWQAGFFAMDQEALRAKLKRSTLVLGDVATTAVQFFADHDPAPVGAVAHDLDFYSSTVNGLKAFDAPAERLMPRVFCYFDDTMGDSEQLYSEFTGERLAIEDFNRSHEQRKIGIPFYLRARQALGAWVHQIWVLHNFDHPAYGQFISADDQQLPLPG
jgi:hypothetical protein